MDLPTARARARSLSLQTLRPYLVILFPQSESYGIASIPAYQMIYAASGFTVAAKFDKGKEIPIGGDKSEPERT